MVAPVNLFCFASATQITLKLKKVPEENISLTTQKIISSSIKKTLMRFPGAKSFLDLTISKMWGSTLLRHIVCQLVNLYF